jgi:hypothetical protein
MGINFGDNTDEYDAEAGTIIPRLSSCHTEADAHRIVMEEFQRWFSDDTASRRDVYLQPSREIWRAWLQFNGKQAI